MSKGTATQTLMILVMQLIASLAHAGGNPPHWGMEEPLCPPDWARDCDPSNPGACFTDPALLRQPYTFKHQKPKSDYVMICAHGMTESPYAMKDIASCAAETGIDVHSLTLAGHDGSDWTSMERADRKSWIRDIKCAVQNARKAGKKPILCGFSTGGLMATRVAMEFEIENLMLFQPALKLNTLPKMADLPGIRNVLSYYNKNAKAKIQPSYERIHKQVVMAITEARKDIEKIADLLMNAQKKMPAHAFVYHSDGDWLIDEPSNNKFYKSYFRDVTFVKAGQAKGPTANPLQAGSLFIPTSEPVPHGGFLRPAKDPKASPLDQHIPPTYQHQNFSALCNSIQSHLRNSVPDLNRQQPSFQIAAPIGAKVDQMR